ncbi:MAG: PAS domain S-box protein [Flavobacteriaceae bacterium]|nr:PAS domain S-box protein [Flavobacteriaceae bacterium]
MGLDFETLSDYLAQILNDDINLSFSETEKYQTKEDKSIIYGLVCLHEDMQYYKSRSQLTIDNLKKALFNTSAVAISNSYGFLTDVNPLFIELSGYSKKEIIGASYKFFMSPHHSKSYYQNILKIINSGNVWRGELCNTKKSGEIYWVYSHIFPIKNHEGNIHEFWSIRTDITQKKKVELELLEKNKALKEALQMKDYLIKEMHHRIKNNLQFLSSMLSIKSRLGDANEAELIKDIINRINSISSLHEILYQKAEHKSIDLKEYLDKTFNTSHFNLNTTLSIRGKKLHIPIETCSYIGVIINELITNSNKYAWNTNPFENKKINLSYQKESGYLIVNYSDNGSGFVESEIKLGLGRTLIAKLITRQLMGTYTEQFKNGYAIKIKIPEQKELILH